MSAVRIPLTSVSCGGPSTEPADHLGGGLSVPTERIPTSRPGLSVGQLVGPIRLPHEPELAAVAARGSKAGFDYRAVVANCAK